MRAAVLNKAMSAGPDEDSGPAPWEIETPDPSQVGQEVIEGSTQSDAFSAEKMIGWVQSGAEVQKAGKQALGGVDFGKLAGAMGVGAGAGALLGPAGAIIGAVVGGVAYLAQALGPTISGTPPQWADAAPGVHQWFTTYGPQTFLDWVRATRPELLASNPQELTKALLLYWLENEGVVITDAPGKSHYSGIPDFVYYNMAGGYNSLTQLYLAPGIDYPKTRLEAHDAGTLSADGISQGLGGVWQYDRKVFVPEKQQVDTSAGSLTLLLGAAVVGGGAYLLSNR
jgi:hypothetical protein